MDEKIVCVVMEGPSALRSPVILHELSCGFYCPGALRVLSIDRIVLLAPLKSETEFIAEYNKNPITVG